MMKPEQIEIAVQEVLNEIDVTSVPANEVLNHYTRSRRYIGSKDRKILTQKVWDELRARPTPKWIQKLISEKELQAMNMPADFILRVNGDRMQMQQLLSEQGIVTTLTPISPLGLVCDKRFDLNTNPLYQQGVIEVQDEGSQLAALATGIQAGDTVLDYCAGAGGKSLCFAWMMQGKGRIVAHDISKRSLQELQKRAKRAGVQIETTLKPQGKFLHVVVDAPCSGSGTWRRCPDARFKLTQAQVKKLVALQMEILNKATKFVAKDGKLHYITCSLLEMENQSQMRTFLKHNPDFKLIHHQQWTPATTCTDGFFLASFEKVSL
ncbi:MAG: RsmB/NOP family class I SAM-dependent RNA methyltransferase [Alphaproteobacteria bacterium]|nr:RsmB/NOP family class I SAM-dependent RNA methyltransferase [Alphaproteobacteria bacterium]